MRKLHLSVWELQMNLDPVRLAAAELPEQVEHLLLHSPLEPEDVEASDELISGHGRITMLQTVERIDVNTKLLGELAPIHMAIGARVLDAFAEPRSGFVSTHSVLSLGGTWSF
jgi:hypothetical protein